MSTASERPVVVINQSTAYTVTALRYFRGSIRGDTGAAGTITVNGVVYNGTNEKVILSEDFLGSGNTVTFTGTAAVSITGLEFNNP